MIIFKFYTRHGDASLPYNPTNRRRIRRILQKNNPQRLNIGVKVHSLKELENFLQTPKGKACLKYSSCGTECCLSTAIDNFEIRNSKKEIVNATNIYFYDEEFVGKLCPFTGVILVDATFDAVPSLQNNSSMQFLTVMAKLNLNGNSKVIAGSMSFDLRRKYRQKNILTPKIILLDCNIMLCLSSQILCLLF